MIYTDRIEEQLNRKIILVTLQVVRAITEVRRAETVSRLATLPVRTKLTALPPRTKLTTLLLRTKLATLPPRTDQRRLT